jgi:hypothetical protein
MSAPSAAARAPWNLRMLLIACREPSALAACGSQSNWRARPASTKFARPSAPGTQEAPSAREVPVSLHAIVCEGAPGAATACSQRVLAWMRVRGPCVGRC